MFISFEGPDGSGKTTQISLLASYLKNHGWDVLTTREPGGTIIGEQVRAILAEKTNTSMKPRTEVLLFQASRAQLVDEIIRPHLRRGGILLSDRFADSTIAYQGYGHQLDLQQLSLVIEFATGGLKPDLTIFLDIDVEEGLQRRARGGDWNRLDAYEVAFHRRAYAGYLSLIQAEPTRWIKIDARQSVDRIHKIICEKVEDRLLANRKAN